MIIYSYNDFYKIKIDSDINQKKILSIYLELQSSLLAPLVRDSKAQFESSSELESFASIVIQIAFSDYETAVAVSQKFGQDEEERYRVCRRNRDRCICTYFHCRCDKISWREPISIYREKKKREKEKKSEFQLSLRLTKILLSQLNFLESSRIERSFPISRWSLVIDAATTVEAESGE